MLMNSAQNMASFSGAKNAPAGLVAMMLCPAGSSEISGSGSEA
jgi:hypothetical protein